jgi:ribosomal protein S18 acetylase RimI-like enzyme
LFLSVADQLDARPLARLRAASLTELGLLRAPAAAGFAARARLEFDTLFRAGRIAAWVGCDDESVVASSCAVFYDRLPYPDGARHAELCGVYVEPAFRRRGIASELVREVIAAARAGGARKTFLRPTHDAKALYARLGFIDSELMTFAGCPAPSEPALAGWPHH